MWENRGMSRKPAVISKKRKLHRAHSYP